MAQVVLILQESSQVDYCSLAADIYHMIFPYFPKVYISLFAVFVYLTKNLGEFTGDGPFVMWVKWWKNQSDNAWTAILFLECSAPHLGENGKKRWLKKQKKFKFNKWGWLKTTNQLCSNSKFAEISLTLSDCPKWIRAPKNREFCWKDRIIVSECLLVRIVSLEAVPSLKKWTDASQPVWKS